MGNKFHSHDPNKVSVSLYVDALTSVVLSRVAKENDMTRSDLIYGALVSLLKKNPPSDEEVREAEEIVNRHKENDEKKRKRMGIKAKGRVQTTEVVRRDAYGDGMHSKKTGKAKR